MGEFIDFTKSWPMSDVVIHTENSNGVALHAYKPILAAFSPYFRAMFFGEFKEKDAELVELHEDFEVFHTALKFLHQQDRTEPGGPSRDHSSYHLGDLYLFADKCDVPLIREFCKTQLANKTSKDALEVAVQLNLDDVKSKLLDSLESAVIQDFLKSNVNDGGFSVADVNLIIKKLNMPSPSDLDRSIRLCTCEGMFSHKYYISFTGICSRGNYHDIIQIHIVP